MEDWRFCFRVGWFDGFVVKWSTPWLILFFNLAENERWRWQMGSYTPNDASLGAMMRDLETGVACP